MAKERARRPACVIALLCLCLSRVYGVELITVYSSDNLSHHFSSQEQYNPTGSSAELVCKYWNAKYSLCGEAVWTNVVTGQEFYVAVERVNSKLNIKRLHVSLDGTYSCHYRVGCDTHSISVIVHFSNPGTSTRSTESTIGTPTQSTGTPQTHFNGLNPLIYTVLSAVLLAVLTIVAIITCFIRSRKAIHRRTLLPRDSPLDYLDFIQENEFTPMTTSEFLASLRERPPTYNESQDIERRIQVEGEDNDAQPPPLPHRNPGMIAERNNRGRSREPSQPPQETTGSNNIVASSNRGQQTSTTVTNERESSRGGGFVDWIEQLDVIVAQSPNQLITELPREQPSSDTSAHGVLPSLDAIV